MDPFETAQGPYDFNKDTSHLLLLALQRQGHVIFYSIPVGLTFLKHQVFARCWRVNVLPSSPFFQFGQEETLPLGQFQLILMRKDPPVDEKYLYATRLLSLVSKTIPVVNDPEALRRWNEKLIVFNFPHWIPPTLVSSDAPTIQRFVEKLGGKAILKSLESFGGKGVSLVAGTSELTQTISQLTHDGRQPIMAQAFLPRITEGEKRLFFVEGRYRGALLRRPAPDGYLTNPDLGGTLERTDLVPREKRLSDEIASFLKRNQIFFAGVDVIGETLIEINITSPGMVWEWNEVDQQRHDEEIVTLMEKKWLKR
jgi:glutathione synthase